jgi:hypothetical protein
MAGYIGVWEVIAKKARGPWNVGIAQRVKY